MQAASFTASLSIATPGNAPTVPMASGTVGYTAQGGDPWLPLVASVPYAVDFAMLPPTGARAILVSIDTQDSASPPNTLPSTATVAVAFTINGTPQAIPLGPGGAIQIVNPSPGTTTGVTAMTLTASVNAIAHVTVLG